MKRIALLISLVFIFICCFAGDRARTRLLDLTNPAAFARHYKVKADNLVAYWNAVHYRDGGSTAQWNDIANGLNDNPLVQATAGNQPSLSTSGPRSRVFDGTDDFMAQKVLATASTGTFQIATIANGAIIYCSALDLSPYAGKFIRVKDIGGKYAWGYPKAVGGGEALGAAKAITGITKANPGVITFQAGHGFVNGELVKFSGLTEMTELNGAYRTLTGKSGDTFTIGNTSTFGAAETTGGNCVNQVTDLPVTGITIVSTLGGATQSWTGQGSGFLPNSIATVEVLEPDFNITEALTVLAWVKPDDGQPVGYNTFVAKYRDTSGQKSYYFVLGANGKLQTGICSDGIATIKVTTDNSVFAAGTQPSFRHVGSVYDSSAQTVVLYNNSSVESSTPTDTIPASIYDTFESFVIGASNVEASQWHLTGSIASVMIFSRALSAAEIANIYNRDKGRF